MKKYELQTIKYISGLGRADSGEGEISFKFEEIDVLVPTPQYKKVLEARQERRCAKYKQEKQAAEALKKLHPYASSEALRRLPSEPITEFPPFQN